MKILSRLLLVGTVLTSIACGTAPEAATTAASQARLAGMIVELHVDDDSTGVRAALTQALTRAGYTVVPPRSGNPNIDLVAFALVTTTESRVLGGLLRVRGQNDTHISLALQGLDGSRLALLEEDVSGRTVAEDDLTDLVHAVVASPATAVSLRARSKRIEFEATARRQADEEEQRRIEAAVEARTAENARLAKLEEDAWKLSRDECLTGAMSTSCDALEKFAWTYAKGSHAAEAEALLEKSRPRMRELKDDELWSKAAPQRCSSPQTEDACAGVASYLAEAPEGKHAPDATKLLKAGEPTLARLRREREAKEAREAAAAEAQVAAYSDTGSSYSGGSGRRSGGGGRVFVRDYYRRDGTHVSSHTRRR